MNIAKIDIEASSTAIAEYVFTKYVEEKKNPKDLYDVELTTTNNTGEFSVDRTIKPELAEEFFMLREIIIALLDNYIQHEPPKEED